MATVECTMLKPRSMGQHKRHREARQEKYGRRQAAKLLKVSHTTLYEWDIALAGSLVSDDTPYGRIWQQEQPLHPYQFGCLTVLKRLRKGANKRTTPVTVTILKNLSKFTMEAIAHELARISK